MTARPMRPGVATALWVAGIAGAGLSLAPSTFAATTRCKTTTHCTAPLSIPANGKHQVDRVVTRLSGSGSCYWTITDALNGDRVDFGRTTGTDRYAVPGLKGRYQIEVFAEKATCLGTLFD